MMRMIKYMYFTVFFPNIPFKFCSMGVEFMINDEENGKLFN